MYYLEQTPICSYLEIPRLCWLDWCCLFHLQSRRYLEICCFYWFVLPLIVG